MQESYEKNDKQSQDNQIQKSSVEIIDQQNDQLNVQNYQIEKQLDNQQQQEEINISDSLVQGQHKYTLKNGDEMHKNIQKTTHCTFQDNQSSQYTKNSHIECSGLESQIKCIKEEWNIQIFDELNINSHLSQNFKNNQDQIFQELQKKRYYLLNKLNLSQNEEVFEGYQPSEQISSNGVCSLYYFAVIHDLNEKDFNQKMQKIVQLKVNNVNFLVDQIEVTQSTKILVLQRQYEFYVDNQNLQQSNQCIYEVCENTKKQIILNEKRDLQQVNQENHEKNTKKAQENQIKILHDEVIQQQNDQLNVLNYHIKKQPDNQQQQKDFIFNEQIQATLVQKEQVNISNENINYSKNFNQKDFDDILIREITIKKSSWKYVKQFLKNLQQPNQCIHEVSQNSKKYAIFNENKDLQQLDNQQQQEEINISASLVQGQHKDILKNTDEMHKNIRKTTHCTFQDNQSSKYTKNSHIKCSDLESKIIFTKEEWNIQIFEELNINSHLSQNFKNNQDQIFQELQKKRYYLLNKLNLSQNEEVFEGYQPSEQISSNGVCSLYYFVVIHDLNEKDFNQKIKNNIDDAGILIIGSSLAKCINLLTLQLIFSENQIGDQALELIYYIAKCIHIFQLDINMRSNSLSQQTKLKFGRKALKLKRLTIENLVF
ncbi:hypothetical protein ABPG73_022995 [Tetrahymena malaccensis]